LVLRHLEGTRVLIAFNADGFHWDLNVAVGEHFEDGTIFGDLLGGEGAVVEAGHLRMRQLAPWQGAVFKAEESV
jgi:hypothetical protein